MRIDRREVFLSRRECLDILNRLADSCVTQHGDGLGSSGSRAYTGALGEDDDAIEAGLMSQLLDALYDEAEEVFYSKRGYVIPSREAALVEATGGSPVYGEITGEGVRQFLEAVPLQRDDVLVDLGSGLGRLTLQAACSARLRRVVGIELSGSRHEQACWVAERLATLARQAAAGDDGEEGGGEGGVAEAEARAEAEPALVAGSSRANYETLHGSGRVGGNGSGSATTFSLQVPGEVRPQQASSSRHPHHHHHHHHHHHDHHHDHHLESRDQQRHREDSGHCPQGDEEQGQQQQQLLLSPVELRCEDLMTADLADGSAFFLCSTAFSAAACRAIAERLAGHPRFRLLVTSRALPFPSPLTQLGQFRCSFSWTAAGTAYVYVRSLREAPAPLLAAFLSAAPPEGVEAAAAAGAGTGAGKGGFVIRSSGGGARESGGIAWLPSLSTMAVIPGDLMV